MNISDDKILQPCEDTPIWRYMSLSSFIMLAKGKLFLPTIYELSKMDLGELEPFGQQWDTYSFIKGKIGCSFINKLMEKYKCCEKGVRECNEYLLGRLYAEEIGKLTCAWCWHQSNHESYTMWQIYGNKGVCIKSSINKLKDFFEAASLAVKIKKILYMEKDCIGPRMGQTQDEYDYCRLAPFLVKEPDFKSENEVRLFCENNTSNENGTLISGLDIDKLVEEVRLYQNFTVSETGALKELLEKELNIKCSIISIKNKFSKKIEPELIEFEAQSPRKDGYRNPLFRDS